MQPQHRFCMNRTRLQDKSTVQEHSAASLTETTQDRHYLWISRTKTQKKKKENHKIKEYGCDSLMGPV